VPERFGTRSRHRRRRQENPGWKYPTSQLTVWFGKRRSAGSGADSGQNEISCCVNLKIWLLVKAYSWLNASSLARQVVHHCSLAAVRYTYLNLVTAYVFSSICWIGFDRRRQFLHRTEECCIWCSEHCILRFQAPNGIMALYKFRIIIIIIMLWTFLFARLHSLLAPGAFGVRGSPVIHIDSYTEIRPLMCFYSPCILTLRF